MRGAAVVHDDSEILVQFEGIGAGIGIWGDQVLEWMDVDLVKRVIDPATSKSFQGCEKSNANHFIHVWF